MTVTSALVVLTGSLGDVVRALPLASILGAARPKPRVTWLVDQRWREIVDAHPAVDHTVTFPARRTVPSLAALWRALRSERYDVALDLQRILKSGILGVLSRAPRRIGFNGADTKEFNHLFTTERIRPSAQRESKFRLYLAFADALGLAVPDTPDFGLASLAVPERLPESLRAVSTPMLGVIVGSSWPSKNWTVDGYADLLARVTVSTPVSCVLLGSAGHQGTADQIMTRAASAPVVNMVGRTSLVQLAAVLASCQAAIGPDTGAGHLAAAVGTPYVTLFGPTDPAVVAPFGCESLAVSAGVDCSPCRRRRCRKWGAGCMTTITADAVWSTLAPLIRHDTPAGGTRV